MGSIHILLFCLILLVVVSSSAFLSVPLTSFHRRVVIGKTAQRIQSPAVILFGGMGIAPDYSWKEEAFEIDVTVQVPSDTRAKDVMFTATSRSVDLRLTGGGDRGKILLDGSRKLRGRVNLDGTYWVISDPEDGSNDSREVTVTIEKLIRPPRDDFEVIEYDWKGVYSNDTEVTTRQYDEPEELDVRDYAASLGVDIDNIDMSKVDKTMFSSGLNLTQASLDELNKAGAIKEITRQADGTEYEVDEEGEPIPFSTLGEGIAKDEIEQAQQQQERPKIPFLDTNSPWHDTVPVEVDAMTNKSYVQQKRNFTRAAFAEDSAKQQRDKEDHAVDPIDTLTVKRLKEILKSQGLKITGNKKQLQDRLRQQVNSLLQGKQNDKLARPNQS